MYRCSQVFEYVLAFFRGILIIELRIEGSNCNDFISYSRESYA